MSENHSELLKRLVVGSKRDGRRRYDKQAKLELVQACLQPGISVARIAYEHGINANLLRKWINLYQHQHGPSLATSPEHAPASASAFIPVVQINGKRPAIPS